MDFSKQFSAQKKEDEKLHAEESRIRIVENLSEFIL